MLWSMYWLNYLDVSDCSPLQTSKVLIFCSEMPLPLPV